MNQLPKIVCEECGANNIVAYDNIRHGEITYIECINCYHKIQIIREDIRIYTENLAERVPVLKIGTVIIITNKQHPWYNQIGIIRNTKHEHYRIEILGKLLWVPENWVEKHE